MSVAILLFTLQFSPCQCGKSYCSWDGKKNGQINTVNDGLTFWMGMTNGRDFGGVFDVFHWSRDVADSEVHFQGLKWRFTHIFISFLTFHDRQQIYIKRKIIMMNGGLSSEDGWEVTVEENAPLWRQWLMVRWLWVLRWNEGCLHAC